MSSQSFLWINVGLAIAMAGLFVIGRSRIRAPARLHLRPSFSKYNPKIPPEAVLSEEISKVSGDEGLGIKNLNVMFMYNGHSWDAFEVLGIPAGSKMPAVQAAYELALRHSKPESHPFLETAYKSILSVKPGA
jgi:hypothetical protein